MRQSGRSLQKTVSFYLQEFLRGAYIVEPPVVVSNASSEQPSTPYRIRISLYDITAVRLQYHVVLEIRQPDWPARLSNVARCVLLGLEYFASYLNRRNGVAKTEFASLPVPLFRHPIWIDLARASERRIAGAKRTLPKEFHRIRGASFSIYHSSYAWNRAGAVTFCSHRVVITFSMAHAWESSPRLFNDSSFLCRFPLWIIIFLSCLSSGCLLVDSLFLYSSAQKTNKRKAKFTAFSPPPYLLHRIPVTNKNHDVCGGIND